MKGFEENTVKSVGTVQNPDDTTISKLAEEEGGFYTYEDRAGVTTDGQLYEDPIDRRQDIAEKKGVTDFFELIEEEQEKHSELKDAVQEARKQAFGAGDVTAELHLMDDLMLSSQEYTPFVETQPRVAIEPSEEVKIDEVEDLASAGLTANTGGNPLPQVEHTVNSGVSYKVKTVGLETAVEERVKLTGQRYNPVATQNEYNGRAIERYMERQGVIGTAHDSAGYEGLYDFAQNQGSVLDGAGASFGLSELRDVKEKLEQLRVPSERIAVLCSIQAHRQLRESLDNVQRIVIGESIDTGEVDYGFNVIRVEEVRVFKTHALKDYRENIDANTQDLVLGYDVESFMWGMLRDIEMKALAPDQLEDKMLTFTEHTLFSIARQRSVALENLN